jgi:hypothetical protein
MSLVEVPRNGMFKLCKWRTSITRFQGQRRMCKSFERKGAYITFSLLSLRLSVQEDSERDGVLGPGVEQSATARGLQAAMGWSGEKRLGQGAQNAPAQNDANKAVAVEYAAGGWGEGEDAFYGHSGAVERRQS